MGVLTMLDKILTFIADHLGIDHVVEQGKNSGGWNYTKWANGKIELSKVQPTMAFSNAVNVGSGAHPWNRAVYSFDMAQFLVSIDSVTANMQSNGYVTQACVNASKKTTVEIFILSTAWTGNETMKNVPIRIVGRWK